MQYEHRFLFPDVITLYSSISSHIKSRIHILNSQNFRNTKQYFLHISKHYIGRVAAIKFIYRRKFVYFTGFHAAIENSIISWWKIVCWGYDEAIRNIFSWYKNVKYIFRCPLNFFLMLLFKRLIFVKMAFWSNLIQNKTKYFINVRLNANTADMSLNPLHSRATLFSTLLA